MTNNTKNLLSFTDWEPEHAKLLLDFAIDLKQNPAEYGKPLAGKSIVALFEKPSLRTRVSFDIGIHNLGGHMVYVDSQGQLMEKREDPKDVGANISQWAQAIVARVFSHNTLVALSSGASVPVVNALCDKYHPCQALADYITLQECYGDISGKTIAYIGDGNNVTHSLNILGILLGCHQVVITPENYEIDPRIKSDIVALADANNVTISFHQSLAEAPSADVIYTDTWLSMGDDTPLEQIKTTFMPFQVNQALMEHCKADYVMHCQPAHRDLEITGELMDSPQSLLMQQAENRMHAQNAILCYLLSDITNKLTK
ncbi:ornithine carbamoyltransferase [Glaciecola petra]|uniref:Ornithine carbamoyltransferase n=1 Tax=Glaciecola petra TaxID=3075602 RepID=A0ABU2ZSX5_9ALTE|nr:ornithine carbamoyltransferase [Aestuariibacter sp. P117]MDT0595520.1 ornithine carbamoyltransferase [Aestuariibacter sp. P117]